jgi:hypothetical protein
MPILVVAQITPAFRDAIFEARYNLWFVLALVVPIFVMVFMSRFRCGLLIGSVLSATAFLTAFCLGLQMYHERTEGIATTTDEVEFLCADTGVQFSLLFVGIPLCILEVMLLVLLCGFWIRMKQNMKNALTDETSCAKCGRIVSVQTTVCPRCNSFVNSAAPGLAVSIDRNPYHVTTGTK